MAKKLIEAVIGHNTERVLGIDHSSNSIAFTLVVDGKPEIWGKMLYHRKSDMCSKFRMIPTLLENILNVTKPTHICVEQSIVLQNPNTARVLATMNGGLICLIANSGFDVQEVPPSEWQNYHGNARIDSRQEKFKNMTAKEKTIWKKSQIADKVTATWPWIKPNDFDITDSMGIALFGAGICLKGSL